MKRIGAHVSASGGVSNAPLNAKAIGADAFALFLKNQRQWSAKPYESAEIDKFKQNLETSNISADHVLPHASYLINLGHPSPQNREKSRNALIDEINRAEILGLKLINFHPGSHLKEIGEEECLKLIALSINEAIRATNNIKLVIENTAGQGSNLGYTFDQIAYIIALCEDKSRIGVCIDTCHAHVAGYDLSTTEGYETMMAEFDGVIGLQYLRGMHLNDAMHGAGSKKDRHAPLGKGTIGLDTFRAIAQDRRTDNIPLILETPEPERWAEEIAMLRNWAEEALS